MGAIAPTLMPPLSPPGSAGPVLGKHSELQNKKVDSVIIYKHVAASSWSPIVHMTLHSRKVFLERLIRQSLIDSHELQETTGVEIKLHSRKLFLERT